MRSDFTKAPKSQAFSFGLSREYFKNVYLKENPPIPKAVPGPGAY